MMFIGCYNLSSEGSNLESDSVDDNTQSDKEKGSDSGHETDENETGSESDQEENEEEVEDDEDETNYESKVEDKAKGNEDKGMHYTTNQFDDDVDQGNENLEITLNQVIEDAHVKISTVTKKTEVPVTSSSHSSDLSSKFLNFLDIPYTDAEIVSLMDFHVHHEVPSNQTPTLLTKEVVELKKDDLLNTQVTTLVDEHLDSRLGATRDKFMSYLSASITARITEQVKIQLP
ncbi:hypothetical protein Tco_1067402 [Tanacetum coccineum]|uniref:Uncharacterized protein n=1 Tax=Tanacetum coccineum TaxID=301880 RepID=A0ABQ5HCR4_9ASTR